MLGGLGIPDPEDLRGLTRTTSGTLATVTAGRFLTANVSMSASVAVAGNSTPTISVSGTNAVPASGTVIARLNVAGLALTTVSDTIETEIIVYAPPENDVTVEFTAGATGTSSASLNGFIFG